MKKPKSIEWDPEDYDAWYRDEKGRLIDLIETDCLLSLLFPVNGSRVIDVGCGTGNFALKLQNLGYDVVCLEPDEKMRQKALEKGLNCVKGFAESIPFEDKTFDAAISVAAVEFFTDVEKAINEMLRVVKTGGKVVIGFITGPWARYYEELGKKGHPIFSFAKFPDIKTFISHPSFKQIKFCLKTPPGQQVSWERERMGGSPGFACLEFVKRSMIE